MNIIIIIAMLLVAATTGVLMFTNGTDQKKQDALSNLAPTPTQVVSVTQGFTPSPSSVVPKIQTNPSSSTTLLSEKAIIKTSKGNIELKFFTKEAPKTVENFLKKAKSGFYNNLTFHRVEDWVIQGGDPLGNGTGGESIQTELNDKPFIIGSLGVARGQDIKISNDAQFFITKKDASWLNSQYTNFGAVTNGMDVVSKIEIGDKIMEVEVK